MFAVAPGMPVTDPRGKVIGHVQNLRQTGSGVVQAVTVEVGDRVATLPAANFAGSGDVLVTGMTKRSEEHTSELQSLMRSSYAVFCLNKKKTQKRKIAGYINKNTK